MLAHGGRCRIVGCRHSGGNGVPVSNELYLPLAAIARKRDHPQYGDLRVGHIPDGLAGSEDATLGGSCSLPSCGAGAVGRGRLNRAKISVVRVKKRAR